MSADLFKMLPLKYPFTNHIYLIYEYMYKQDLALNNLQELIGQKIQPANLGAP